MKDRKSLGIEGADDQFKKTISSLLRKILLVSAKGSVKRL